MLRCSWRSASLQLAAVDAAAAGQVVEVWLCSGDVMPFISWWRNGNGTTLVAAACGGSPDVLGRLTAVLGCDD